MKAFHIESSFQDFLDDLDADEIIGIPGVFEPLAHFYMRLIGRKVDFRDEDELDYFLEFIEDQGATRIASIPGIFRPLAKYYSEAMVADATYRRVKNPIRLHPDPIKNPPGVVKTAQDERDWEKAKAYYARGAVGPERSWGPPDWATVMVIYKNIKAKRRRRRR